MVARRPETRLQRLVGREVADKTEKRLGSMPPIAGGMEEDQDVTIALGSDSWMEMPEAPPSADQPYRDHFIQLLSQ